MALVDLSPPASATTINFVNTEAINIDGGGGTGADTLTMVGTGANNAFTLNGTGPVADTAGRRQSAGHLPEPRLGRELHQLAWPGGQRQLLRDLAALGTLPNPLTINVIGGDWTASDTLVVGHGCRRDHRRRL